MKDEVDFDKLDYAELIVQMQKALAAAHEHIKYKKYALARNEARELATDAMLIAIWCQKYLDKK